MRGSATGRFSPTPLYIFLDACKYTATSVIAHLSPIADRSWLFSFERFARKAATSFLPHLTSSSAPLLIQRVSMVRMSSASSEARQRWYLSRGGSSQRLACCWIQLEYLPRHRSRGREGCIMVR